MSSMRLLQQATRVSAISRTLSTRSRNDRGPVLNAAVAALSRVRLVDAKGEDSGVMSGAQAVKAAKRAGLDVLQVARNEDMPVVKLLDYEAVQQQRNANRKPKHKPKPPPKLKQVRLSPATADGDRDMKLRQARRFLLDGHRVRVFMLFRRGHGRLRDDACSALCAIAEALVPSVASLKTGDLASLRGSLQPPPQVNDGEPRVHKPLEIYFEPLSKAQRQRIVAEQEQEVAI